MSNNEKLQKVLGQYLTLFEEKGPESTDPELINTFVKLYGLSQKDDEQALERLKFQSELEAAELAAKSSKWDKLAKIGGAVLNAATHGLLGAAIMIVEDRGVFGTTLGKAFARHEANSLVGKF